MENMERLKKFYKNKKVLVTGHTGFKGSWLNIWLKELGADIRGYSIDFPTNPNNFQISGMTSGSESSDIRDFEKLRSVFWKFNPDIVFHLAAQPIVIRAYQNPKEAFETNALGTVNVLEAARQRIEKKKMGLVCITTDKVYENQNWSYGYRENDTLGGKEPYGASKAMAEIAIAAYRESFFENPKENVALSSARAGNVIGGGDFAEYRLVPDAMKALMEKKKIIVRNPKSIRPWQHVLEPLSGYLWLAMNNYNDPTFSGAWNFGPRQENAITCESLVTKIIQHWNSGEWIHENKSQKAKEDKILTLNCDKAYSELKWKPVYDIDKTLEETVSWYKVYHLGICNMHDFAVKQIKDYAKSAKEQGLAWAQ